MIFPTHEEMFINLQLFGAVLDFIELLLLEHVLTALIKLSKIDAVI